MFANLLLYPLISEFLTAFDYFVFGTMMGYLGLMSMVGDLGMHALFQNSYYKREKHYQKFWARYLGFLMTYRLFYGALAFGLVHFVLSEHLPEGELWLVTALVVMPMVTFDLPKTLGMRLMQYKHKHYVVHRITLFTGAITVLTTFITIYIFKLGYLGFFISTFVSGFVQGLFFTWVVFVSEGVKISFNLRRKRIAGWLRVSLPLIPHNFSNYLLSSSDRVVLDRYLGVADVSTSSVGMYNVAYNFAQYFGHFNQQVNTIVSPIFFGLFRDKSPATGDTIKSFTLLWFMAAFLTAALAGLWSKEVFSFFFMRNTDGLAGAYRYTIFLFLAFCYRPLYVASVVLIIYNEKTTSLLKITTAAGVLNVVLNIALVPFFGIEAAIFTTYLCYMYMGISGHLFPDTRRQIPTKIRTLPLFFGITLAGIGITYAVEWSIPVKALLTLGLLTIAYLGYRWRGAALIAQLKSLALK